MIHIYSYIMIKKQTIAGGTWLQRSPIHVPLSLHWEIWCEAKLSHARLADEAKAREAPCCFSVMELSWNCHGIAMDIYGQCMAFLTTKTTLVSCFQLHQFSPGSSCLYGGTSQLHRTTGREIRSRTEMARLWHLVQSFPSINIWGFPKMSQATHKSSILMGFSLINHLGVPPFMETPIFGSSQTCFCSRLATPLTNMLRPRCKIRNSILVIRVFIRSL